jgi:hypothetical protein
MLLFSPTVSLEHRNRLNAQKSQGAKMKLKTGFIVTIIILIGLSAPSHAQRIEGFAQVGVSKGYSIFGALQIAFDLVKDVTYGTRVELAFVDGNSNQNDNPKLELQPYITYDTPIISDTNYNLSGGVTLRTYARVFSKIANNTVGVDYDLSLRLQPAINGSITITPGWRAYAGTGAGLQFGLLPSQGILYSFIYVYGFAKGDLSSLLPKLEAVIGGGASSSFDSNFKLNDPAIGGSIYGALEYQLDSNFGLRFQTGYSTGNSSVSFDTPESNGFYVFLRGSFRL